MFSTNKLIAMLAVASLVSFSSCDDDDSDDPKPSTVSSKTVANLPADTAFRGFSPQGPPIFGTGRFTLFNLKTGQIVPNSDSATANWHVGFRGTDVCVNGGVSGPGNVMAQPVIGSTFTAMSTAPEAGYYTDSLSNGTSKKYVFKPSGTTNGWYLYTPKGSGAGQYGIISPRTDRFYVVKTGDGKYAKIEILSYYKDSPADPQGLDINTATYNARLYTFRYVYQDNGTRNF